MNCGTIVHLKDSGGRNMFCVGIGGGGYASYANLPNYDWIDKAILVQFDLPEGMEIWQCRNGFFLASREEVEKAIQDFDPPKSDLGGRAVNVRLQNHWVSIVADAGYGWSSLELPDHTSEVLESLCQCAPFCPHGQSDCPECGYIGGHSREGCQIRAK